MRNYALTGLVLALMSCATPPATPNAAPWSSAVPRSLPYRTVEPMHATVRSRILPQIERLMQRVIAEGRTMRMDGISVFDAGDQYLPGKIAIAFTYILLDTPPEDPRFERSLSSYRRIMDLTANDPNRTWGAYYSLLALYKLQRAGLLERAVSPETLARLRQTLDWRSFVRESDFSLEGAPANYYGVAFGIARLRYLLGWEDQSASAALLQRTLDHYRQHSGAFGFSDETDGEGRYDRYSVLLIGEIAQRFIETGEPPPSEVRGWLRRSVDVILPRLNLRGEGFEYGRSIGPYGETAFVEVLSAAAALGVLSFEEQCAAYAFSARATARYADFWLNADTDSVNLWDGRRTDAYRGKHRMLGENFSLARQYIYTSTLWRDLQFPNQQCRQEFADWLDQLPTTSVTWFADTPQPRVLITYRDGDHVIGLPLINGGAGQHMNTPYFPIPFSPGMLLGAPDEDFPQLLPRITLADGTRLAPLAYFEDIRVRERGDRVDVEYHQDAMDRLGGNEPIRDDRIRVETRYVIVPGRITRVDRLIPREPLEIAHIELEFASFSDRARIENGSVRYGEGDVEMFAVEGLNDCTLRSLADEERYTTPVGSFSTLVTCRSGPSTNGSPLTVSWSLEYR